MSASASSRPQTSRALHSWLFTFTDKASGRPVTSGVFASDFTSARNKALGQLALSNGGDADRFKYASYKRLC